MAKIKTFAHDAADYVETTEDAALLLQAALEDGDPGVVAEAIGAIARACGMSDVAEATGLSRESLYRALSAGGNPTLSTTLQVLQALGLQLTVAKPKRTRKAADAAFSPRGKTFCSVARELAETRREFDARVPRRTKRIRKPSTPP